MLKIKVLETIKKYKLIEKADKIVVGVSGGPDSICLINILNEIKNDKMINLNFELIVAHVNHMIRENAKLDEEFVKEFCIKNDVPCFVKKVDVLKKANEDKIGTEEAGRNVRYEFFNEVLNNTGSDKIAIAHNKNDSVETVILNIIRGTGTAGLIGIESKNGRYIRPLIRSERIDIERYCRENNLNPRIDESNSENIYNRNKVRNIIIPYIKDKFNPNIINTIDKLSDIIKEEEIYINNIVNNIYKKILIEERDDYIKVNLKEFNNQELLIRKKMIFYITNKLMGTTKGLEKVNIEDIIKLCGNNIGNKYLIPYKELKVVLKNKQLYFEKSKNNR